MWYKLPIDKRMELMKTYKKGGYSYSDMIKDYNDSYEKFEGGGTYDDKPKPKPSPYYPIQTYDDKPKPKPSPYYPIQTYNPSETVNQSKIENPYKKAAIQKAADEKERLAYLEQEKQKKANEDKVRERIRAQQALDLKNKVPGYELYDEDYEVQNHIKQAEYKKKIEEGTNEMMLGVGLALLPVAGELAGAKYLKNASKYNPFTKFKVDPNKSYRMLGEEGFVDANEYGALRAKPQPLKVDNGISLKRNTNRNPNTGKLQPTLNKPYFSEGYVDERYGSNYMAEVNTKANNLIKQHTHKGVAGPKEIPLKDVQMYKKHWWRGYEPIEQDNKIIQDMLDKEWLLKSNSSKYYPMNKQNSYLNPGGS